MNGATCINEPGSFRCVCPPDKTGMHCGNPLHANAITSGAGFLGRGADNWLYIIIAVVVGVVVLIISICVLTILKCGRKKRRPIENPKDSVLNSNIHQHEKIKVFIFFFVAFPIIDIHNPLYLQYAR